jgi:hypothetical protein
MESSEAQHVLTEILEILENSSMDSYLLAEVIGSHVNPEGYAVEVKAFLGTVRKQRVYDIAKKHGLNVIEEREGVTLYKAKP